MHVDVKMQGVHPRYDPHILLSDPGRIRTCNQQNRNLSFYPIELRGLVPGRKALGVGEDSRTPVRP